MLALNMWACLEPSLSELALPAEVYSWGSMHYPGVHWPEFHVLFCLQYVNQPFYGNLPLTKSSKNGLCLDGMPSAPTQRHPLTHFSGQEQVV